MKSITPDFSSWNWICESPYGEIKKESNSMTFSNAADDIIPFWTMVPSASDAAEWIEVNVDGESVSGSSGVLCLADEVNNMAGEATIPSNALMLMRPRKHLTVIVRVHPHSAVRIRSISMRSCSAGVNRKKTFIRRSAHEKVAVIVPTYPTAENKYLCAFVHARVKAYQEAGLDCDVICAFDYQEYCAYSFEGVRVLRMCIDDLPYALSVHRYDVLLLHFFDERYAKALEKKPPRTQVLLWSHNPETRYWDWPLFTAPYFSRPAPLTDQQIAEFHRRDELIKRVNDDPNYSWVFVSQTLKERSEELIGIRFKQAYVIPNLIDEKRFAYAPKNPELRKKIFLARKFDNVATYAIDIDVACIVELSKRPFFKDLEFNIFGTGNFFEKLVAPIKNMENVKLNRRFLSHDEIAKQHARHGIALFATRFDSQGVSMDEAAMSGLVVVSSDIDAARNYLPVDKGLLCEVENPKAYADVIERLYNDPDYFLECSQACHDKVYSLCRREKTTLEEMRVVHALLDKAESSGIGLLDRIKSHLKSPR